MEYIIGRRRRRPYRERVYRRRISFLRMTEQDCSVAQAYVNQRKLDHEVKTLQVQAGQFSKQTAQWISMVEGFNQALKEIGDVENWARSIEMDMRTIATALEYVHKGQLQSAPS
ncbi:biogenesis of lysosome-related organelles complex 1 subunit 1 isoform X4 [Phyllopteryx taeniolatus]|uniref:biogenesis of lysosome-related organelles complex 1 subunit 1 isoform X4 n=1 Tax=Phyllopteryx taeniolatus TaxID=161469 RepID=UPI002AD54BED|nr:biogenesis of lysosome-related organelles complex 1 subunit 1 isoform X4 [Phyllopteryx taeniolatus]